MNNPVMFLITLISVISCQSQNQSNNSRDARLYGSLDSLYKSILRETTLINQCENSGKVYIDYLIDNSGKVVNPEVAKGFCEYADSVALKIVERLRYSPAHKNGIQIQVRKSLPIYFIKEH